LGAGAAFQFLGRSTGRTFVTQQQARILDDENGLVELRTDATAYLVEGTTIVRLVRAVVPPSPAPRRSIHRTDETLRRRSPSEGRSMGCLAVLTGRVTGHLVRRG
jgi:hypothetical protein